MEIRNNTEGLKTLLGISSTPASEAPAARKSESGSLTEAFSGDQATLSQAATEISNTAAHADVRADKVAAIQQAVAAGTYSVPASAVAEKVMDAMAGASLEPGE